MVVGDATGVRELIRHSPSPVIRGKSRWRRRLSRWQKPNRQQRFFFHGQFNTGLWLALLSGGIRPAQFNWHIWGADLYENSQPEVSPVLSAAAHGAGAGRARFATRGDLSWFAAAIRACRASCSTFRPAWIRR
jgi:dTDP-N-acetylfucosamine:lipid II N-acetylfucosaminyltransferase